VERSEAGKSRKEIEKRKEAWKRLGNCETCLCEVERMGIELCAERWEKGNRKTLRDIQWWGSVKGELGKRYARKRDAGEDQLGRDKVRKWNLGKERLRVENVKRDARERETPTKKNVGGHQMGK
jgi:hypothetical protein